jgi:TPR repeat protein
MHHYEAATQHSSSSDDKQVILAHYFIGLHYRLGTLVTQNNTKAVHHLTIAAHADYAPAQRALGLMYLEGVPGYLTRNETMAYEWLTKAAVQGDTQSLGLLGQRAERGDRLSSAISMYTQAAQAGSIAAQLSLAHLLLRMDRRAEAYPWFQMAASFSSGGDLHVGYVRQRNVARLMVARYKFNGWDGVVDVDRALAYQEFANLADQDQLPEAYFWMAACYDEGVTDQNGAVVVKQDSKLAFDYYMKSALTGDVDGQFHVALMLANGRGAIEKDVSRAFQW